MEATDCAEENPEMASYHEIFKCSSRCVSRPEAGRGAKRNTTEVGLGGGKPDRPANSEDSALRETADSASTAWQAHSSDQYGLLLEE